MKRLLLLRSDTGVQHLAMADHRRRLQSKKMFAGSTSICLTTLQPKPSARDTILFAGGLLLLPKLELLH
jgi:hypothetical protein